MSRVRGALMQGWRGLCSFLSCPDAEEGQEEEEHPFRAKVLAVEEMMLEVMGVVGEGHHLFIAGVSKDWRRLYSAAHPVLKTSLRHSVLGSVECLNWAVTRGFMPLSMETFQAAAEWGDVGICQALHRYSGAWGASLCEAAAQNAKHGLSILKWLRSEDLPDKSPCPWDTWTCTIAAGRGDVGMLMWLLSDETNAPHDWKVWAFASREGHLRALDILLIHPKIRAALKAAQRDDDWRWGPYFAAVGGQLEVLRWLHANARDLCDWDSIVCHGAVTKAQSLAVLQWLRSESVMCGWDRFSCPEVLLNMGSWDGGRNEAFEEIKQWVHANGHPCDCED